MNMCPRIPLPGPARHALSPRQRRPVRRGSSGRFSLFRLGLARVFHGSLRIDVGAHRFLVT